MERNLETNISEHGVKVGLAYEFLDDLTNELFDKKWAKEIEDIKKMVDPTAEVTGEQLNEISALIQDLIMVDNAVDLLTKKLLIATRINTYGLTARINSIENK